MPPKRIDPDSIEQIRMIVRVSAQLRTDFDAACKARGTTISQVLRKTAERWVAEDKRRAER